MSVMAAMLHIAIVFLSDGRTQWLVLEVSILLAMRLIMLLTVKILTSL